MKSKLAILGGTPIFNQNQLIPYKAIGYEEVLAVTKIAQSGNLSGFVGSWSENFFGGEVVKQLEKEWASEFKSKHAISVNSNTSGLIASMGAIGLEAGDEVIVPPLSMSATAVAPLFYGAIPVFVDIEEETFCLDVDLVRNAINSKTKAIIAVNLFGHPAKLHLLREIADSHNIKLIEDNAQAPRATEYNKFTGTVGHIGVFSLNYHKHIHCGEGGICTTDDDNLALRLQLIRNHAESCVEAASIHNINNLVGYNFRMTELSAAVALEQLKKSKLLIDTRVAIAKELNNELGDLDGLAVPKPRENCQHVYYMWQMRFKEDFFGLSRKIFSRALDAEGFPNFCGYVRPLYLLPIFQQKIAFGHSGYPFNLNEKINYQKGICPVAERLHEDELIGFDICAYDLSENQLKLIIHSFQKVYENINELHTLDKHI